MTTSDPIRAELVTGARVTVEFRGATYTGTVRNAYRSGGHFRWEGGTMTNLELGELDSVSIITDKPVPTPAGRTVDSIHIRKADGFDRIQIIGAHHIETDHETAQALTIDSVADAVSAIRRKADAGDWEAAVSRESELYVAVLRAVVADAPRARVLASLALDSQNIDFPRS